MSAWIVMPTRTNESFWIAAMRAFNAAASSVSSTVTATPAGLKNLPSWRKRTVSSPTANVRPSPPSVTFRIGGADAPASAALASSLTNGHSSMFAFFWASCIAKAMHVGRPHFLQLVFGSSLKMSSPDNAMSAPFFLACRLRERQRSLELAITPPTKPYSLASVALIQ